MKQATATQVSLFHFDELLNWSFAVANIYDTGK